jgi:hypothetical protein
VEIPNLTKDLNSKIDGLKKSIAENAITVLQAGESSFQLAPADNNKPHDVLYLSIGTDRDNALAKRLRADYHADVIYFNYLQDAGRIASTVELAKKYRTVIIGIHRYNRAPARNFGISKYAADLAKKVQEQTSSYTFIFGNPYATKNFCKAKNLVACYEDDDIVQETAVDLLQGKIPARGKLPVTVCPEYPFGTGMKISAFALPSADPAQLGLNAIELNKIDSVAENAIRQGATPGCVVLALKDGKIAYFKAFGHYNYDNLEPVTTESVYDMASVTKICATTISVMKLYEQGKIDLKKTLGDYLPWVKESDKENLVIEKILLHQAGLVAFIPFYKETLDSTGSPVDAYYSTAPVDSFKVRVGQEPVPGKRIQGHHVPANSEQSACCPG